MALRILLFILTIATPGCRKETITPSYHNNIFRCKVNGVEWTPACLSDGLFGVDPIRCQYYSDTPSLEIVGLSINSAKTLNQSIHMHTFSEFLLNAKLPPGLPGIFKDLNKSSGCRYYTIDTSFAYHLTLSEVDTINFLVKGNFEYTALNDCNDTVRITDGFFHVNFRF